MRGWLSRWSSQSKRPAVGTGKPSVETLEERSLPDASSYVGGLYLSLLNRSPGPEETSFWVNFLNSGHSGRELAAAIVHSPEYMSGVVDDAYQTLLGRGVDPSGLNYWVSQLNAGLSPERLEVLIIASDEYFARHGGTIDGYLRGLYRDMLGRDPDDGGLAFWTEYLEQGEDRGLPAEVFADGSERHGHEVEEAFLHVLHRSPDDVGRQFWLQQLDQGLDRIQLIIELEGSHEHGLEFEFEVEFEDRGGRDD